MLENDSAISHAGDHQAALQRVDGSERGTSISRRRRLRQPLERALGLGIALFVIGGTIASAAGPANATTPFQVTTWNLAQGNLNYSALYNTKIFEIVGYVQSHPSWQLSLQEACNGQAAQIAWYLNSSGSSFTWFWGTASGGNVACDFPGAGSYGNAVLNIGTPLPGYGGARFHILQPKPPNLPEDKNVICGGMQNFGFRYEGCSLHVTPSVDYVPAQVNDAQSAVAAFTQADSASSVVAGDFNLPFVPPLSSMPWQFTSWSSVNVEASLPWYRTTSGSANPKMIDYVWAQPLRFARTAIPSCVTSSSSDHRICPGLFAAT